MTDADSNVISFAPRPKALPALRCVELRLDSETCGLQMSVADDAGNVVATLAYDLVYVTPGFDLDLLRRAWDEWRGGSARAS